MHLYVVLSVKLASEVGSFQRQTQRSIDNQLANGCSEQPGNAYKSEWLVKLAAINDQGMAVVISLRHLYLNYVFLYLI